MTQRTIFNRFNCIKLFPFHHYLTNIITLTILRNLNRQWNKTNLWTCLSILCKQTIIVCLAWCTVIFSSALVVVTAITWSTVEPQLCYVHMTLGWTTFKTFWVVRWVVWHGIHQSTSAASMPCPWFKHQYITWILD